MESDRLRRFLFEDAPVRGHWVRLSRAWVEAREHQNLEPAAMALLGESLAAVALFSASLKFRGALTLQLEGSSGPVSMLVAQAPTGVRCAAWRMRPPSTPVQRRFPSWWRTGAW